MNKDSRVLNTVMIALVILAIILVWYVAANVPVWAILASILTVMVLLATALFVWSVSR